MKPPGQWSPWPEPGGDGARDLGRRTPHPDIALMEPAATEPLSRARVGGAPVAGAWDGAMEV